MKNIINLLVENHLYFRELLSPQQHYDWGLRALKTVLRGCGNLLQMKKKAQSGKWFYHCLLKAKYIKCFMMVYVFHGFVLDKSV